MKGSEEEGIKKEAEEIRGEVKEGKGRRGKGSEEV